jgi:2-polyprenyl-6-methoxyphenol hydroxylase-like FAD-dependent oxidoreductase
MLADCALSLRIDVGRECYVTSFVQRADGVEAKWTSPTGADHIRCTYFVGCDGGRSFIRKMAGFDSPGTEPSSTFYQAVAQIDHPERLAPMGWRRTSGGVFSYGPFPGRLVMLEFSGPPEDQQAPITREAIEIVRMCVRVTYQERSPAHGQSAG